MWLSTEKCIVCIKKNLVKGIKCMYANEFRQGDQFWCANVCPVIVQGAVYTADVTHFTLFIGSKQEMENSEKCFLEGSADLEEHGVQKGGDCRKRKPRKSKCPA